MLNGKSFWENVFIFFLLDIFFGFLVIAIVCALGLLVQYFAYPLVPVTLQHIKKATAGLSLIYIVHRFSRTLLQMRQPEANPADFQHKFLN